MIDLMPDRVTADSRMPESRDQLESLVQERTAELAAVNEELRRFAYMVSHDLRAPLVNMNGFLAELRGAIHVVQGVVESLRPHLSDAQKQAVAMSLYEDIPEALDFIGSSVRKMARLSNAVLMLSQIGRRELIFERIDTLLLVQEILATLAFQINQKKVTVDISPLPEVIADQVALEQIMSNLLTNALTYLRPERAGYIRMWSEAAADKITFFVQDNGRGIAAADQEKIFEPFYRVGRQDTPGEGMGLTYTQTLVRRHGGHIYCQSEPEQGTTFVFSLSNYLVPVVGSS
jgi:signal transduction histidine kinase